MSRPSRARVAVASVVGVVVAANVALAAVASLVEEPSGPPSSSYATAPDGAAAYAELLRRNGHAVRRIRTPLAEAELDPATTVVVLDPGVLPREDGESLARFVEGGGVLVAGGERPGGWVQGLLDEAPSWSPEGATTAEPLVPVPEAGGVRRLQADGTGSWEEAGEAVPLLAGDGRVLAVVASRAGGRMTLLADTSPFRNRLLPRADNAAFALAVAGGRDRPVHFVESVHGYGRGTGWRAVPSRWRWALGGLVVAALVLIWARGRRLGPAEAEVRDLPPPRRDYVESLAAVLARTKRPGDAAEPLRAAARDRLARRAGMAGEPEDEALRRAAERLGLGEAETAAVFGAGRDRAALLGAARALARLEADGGRRG
jgi:hypothetical protein